MQQTERAKGPGYETQYLRQEELVSEMVAHYRAGKPVHWPVVGQALLSRVWSDFVRDGYVRDERALDNIFASIRDNVVRLQIANIVGGHEAISAEAILSDYLDETEHEAFCTWLVDYEDGWRISDYGIKPLCDAIALAFEARTATARLKYIDRALHVTHMRGDLSKLFVEGGRRTVAAVELAEAEVA